MTVLFRFFPFRTLAYIKGLLSTFRFSKAGSVSFHDLKKRVSAQRLSSHVPHNNIPTLYTIHIVHFLIYEI